jgi:hypothetical protein
MSPALTKGVAEAGTAFTSGIARAAADTTAVRTHPRRVARKGYLGEVIWGAYPLHRGNIYRPFVGTRCRMPLARSLVSWKTFAEDLLPPVIPLETSLPTCENADTVGWDRGDLPRSDLQPTGHRDLSGMRCTGPETEGRLRRG